MSVRSPKKLWLEQFFKGITMGVVSFTRTQVCASLNRLRRVPARSWKHRTLKRPPGSQNHPEEANQLAGVPRWVPWEVINPKKCSF